MADETNPATSSEIATTPEIALKKTRAPRGSKTAKAAGQDTVAAKAPRGRKKREAASSQPATVSTGRTQRKTDSANTAGKRAPRKASSATMLAISEGDDLADLLKLEEENKRLRKTLAEKLRAENADLKKRIGL